MLRDDFHGEDARTANYTRGAREGQSIHGDTADTEIANKVASLGVLSLESWCLGGPVAVVVPVSPVLPVVKLPFFARNQIQITAVVVPL